MTFCDRLYNGQSQTTAGGRTGSSGGGDGVGAVKDPLEVLRRNAGPLIGHGDPERSKVSGRKTGMNLSPYFPASKIAWLLENEEGAKAAAERHEICHGTIDSWLVYKLTGGKEYRTDYSNASRTQLFNIFDLKWDEEICGLFGIDPANMAEVTDSDACFGETDFEGLLPHKIPIHGVMAIPTALFLDRDVCSLV